MTMAMTAWNVEHGSAIHVVTPNGRNLVIDLGGTSYFSPLSVMKSPHKSSVINSLIVTHPHLDHIEDILNLDGLTVISFSRPSLSEEEVWGGNKQASPTTREIIEKYLDMDRRYNSPLGPADVLTNPANWGGVRINTYRPALCDTGNINNRSIITALEYQGVKILIPGDNEACSWEELLKHHPGFAQTIENTHVLVAAHHGRESGYYNDLFKHFSPLLTVVSDGRSVDTSATSRYSAVSQGWKVHKRKGGSEDRKCVTTRNDGIIDIKVGLNSSGNNYLYVEID